MEQQTEITKEPTTAHVNYATLMLAKRDQSAWEIKMALVEQGLEETSATKLIDELEVKVEAAVKKRARKDMLFGALWFTIGLTITIVTYTSASGGGKFVVTYGAIIFGVIQFARGFAKTM